MIDIIKTYKNYHSREPTSTKDPKTADKKFDVMDNSNDIQNQQTYLCLSTFYRKLIY